MIRVSLIGSGNVAQHLIQAFSKTADIELVQVFARHPESLSNTIPSSKIITNLNDLKAVDMVIIAVSDEVIAAVSSQIPFHNQLVVHTSGSVAMEALDDKNRKGVFYPLQTFSKSKAIDFTGIPICLEAEHMVDFKTLEALAKAISSSVYAINSVRRSALHVAADFTSNFDNQLYQIGNEICEENQLSCDSVKILLAVS